MSLVIFEIIGMAFLITISLVWVVCLIILFLSVITALIDTYDDEP